MKSMTRKEIIAMSASFLLFTGGVLFGWTVDEISFMEIISLLLMMTGGILLGLNMK